MILCVKLLLMQTVLTFSKPGGHTANEDAFLTQPHPDDDSLLICALADGQGGRPGGAAAAERACAVAMAAACSYSPKKLTKTKTWLKILSEADKEVHQDPEAGFTTLVALCITADAVWGASSGDSAAVLLNVYDQYHELTAGQVKNPPVGSGQARFTGFSELLIDPWLVLLTSDGLWKYVGWPDVKTLLKRHRGEVLLDALTREARVAGGGTYRDDTTLIIVEERAVDERTVDESAVEESIVEERVLDDASTFYEGQE